MTAHDLAPDATPCVLCGGRGGWWTDDGNAISTRTACTRCSQTGWEPAPAVRAAIAAHTPESRP